MDAARLLDFSHEEPPEGVSPWVDGHRPGTDLTIADPDPRWAEDFAVLAARIRAALGGIALEIDHVGSTSVPGLPAKPIIDVAVVVGDPGDEEAYLPALQRAGFVLVVREPWWHDHRCLRHADPRANVHVFGTDCPEVARMRIFRDWLRTHPDDLAAYRDAKLAAAQGGGHVMEYNARKQDILREIVVRAISAH